MSPSSPILVSLDPNEAARPRAKYVREAVADDEHFYSPIGEKASLPFDMRFYFHQECENLQKDVNCEPCDQGPCEFGKTLHIELKDFSEEGNSDYLASILNGHLWGQCLAARELGEPMIIAVLGDDRDVNEAIKIAASRNHRVDAKKLFQYFQMVDGFEANCIGLGIPVWRLKTDPWKRLLLRVRKILEGGDISGFAPKPSDGERQVVGLSILAGRGVGPKMAANILQRYNLCLVLRDGCCGDLVDCEGIGPKRAEMIRKNLEVIE